MSGLKFIKYNRPKISVYARRVCHKPFALCLAGHSLPITIGAHPVGEVSVISRSLPTGRRGYWIGYFLIPLYLTAAHAIAAIQTFIAGTTANGDMSAGVTGRCIALHAFSCCIDRIHAYFCFFNSGFYRF